MPVSHTAAGLPEWRRTTRWQDLARWSGWLGLDALRAELTKAGVPY